MKRILINATQPEELRVAMVDGLPCRSGETVGHSDGRHQMNRNDLRHQGEAMLRTLFGSAAQPAGFAN